MAWSILAGDLFNEQLVNLVDQVEDLIDRCPDDFDAHPIYRLFSCVDAAMYEHVPRNPSHPEFLLGDTLQKASNSLSPKMSCSLSHWRRVKKRMPDRYRLFFWFSSENKSIIFSWLNPSDCLRQSGGKKDVYKVFCEKIRSGEIPNSWAVLSAESCLPTRFNPLD